MFCELSYTLEHVAAAAAFDDRHRVGFDHLQQFFAGLLPPDRRAPMLGRDDPSSDTQVDVMTEEQLLRGLESMTPLEPSANIGSGPGPRDRDRDPRDRSR